MKGERQRDGRWETEIWKVGDREMEGGTLKLRDGRWETEMEGGDREMDLEVGDRWDIERWKMGD